MKLLAILTTILLSQSSPALAQTIETPISDVGAVEDITALYEILAGLPDQIMAVLLAYLCFKTFLDMVK